MLAAFQSNVGLERRGTAGGDGEAAMDYVRRAYRLSKTPLIEEPLRTFTTAGVAFVLARLGRDPLRLMSALRPRAA
ncbi:hypothetical protein [Celeribacter sp.]|uniref:hypothetical protein n=1 Tax=Celeribacter sp. TaxID=1890673 RepID=UPI003A900229